MDYMFEFLTESIIIVVINHNFKLTVSQKSKNKNNYFFVSVSNYSYILAFLNRRKSVLAVGCQGSNLGKKNRFLKLFVFSCCYHKWSNKFGDTLLRKDLR